MDEQLVTGATILRPGDRVLLTVDGLLPVDKMLDARETLTERFPEVQFTFVTARSVLVMRDDD